MGFSVLMSVYRKEKPEYLAEALSSVSRQSMMPNEIVLMEDGPLTAELEWVITEFQKEHSELVTYRLEENVQLGRALAKGVELCSYELIARMDTDDIALPDRFERQYQYMEQNPEIAVCGGWLEEFDDTETYSKKKTMPETQKELYQYAKYRNPLNHMTVMFRRAAVLDAGNYRHFPLLEDYDLWIRMLAGGCQIYNLPYVLVRMRTSDGMYGRRGGITYYRRYRELRREQMQLGMYGRAGYVFALLVTAVMTLQPVSLRKIAYRSMLRK